MAKIYVPSGKLTWQEKLEIRKHALECATRARAQGSYSPDQLVYLARVFENYLMGEENG
jgi:hypothetical protein